MPENRANSIHNLIRTARERLGEEFEAHAGELQKLGQSLRALRSRHQQLEDAVQNQLEALARFQPSSAAPSQGVAVALDKVLAGVRNLITATLPEQVFDVLTEEAEQMGVRAAVFDVRGKSAWGAAARGFDPALSKKVFRALVVPLNQDNPFRQAYETGGHVDVTLDLLKKNRNILDKLKPGSGEPILLLPIRSAGSVSAIFYTDPGGRAKELPVDALKILAEFAGAQLDRLMALSGGLPAGAAEKEVGEVELAAAASPGHVEAETEGLEPWEEAVLASGAAPQASSTAVAEAPPGVSSLASEAAGETSAVPSTQAAEFDISQLSEADQKVHKDARRFAKLLISEIELYNKTKVADGRKNKDLYVRLKKDIDRSRQTYEKRFVKTLPKQFDYFHDELVRTLAGNEPSLLGSDYPGPSV